MNYVKRPCWTPASRVMPRYMQLGCTLQAAATTRSLSSRPA
jgi:hypothetical protein